MAKKRLRDLLRRAKPAMSGRAPQEEPKLSPPDAETPALAVEATPGAREDVPAQRERSLPEYLEDAAGLRQAGRFDEAEALLTEAIERFPAEARPRFEWALLPHFRLDWAEAARRSEIIRSEFPDAPAAHALAAIVLRELGRYDDAESLLAAARERFPDDLRIANESAWLASHRRDWAQALRRWGTVRKQFPDWPGGYTGTAMIYRELTWFDEAEVTLEDALERFPAEPDLCIEHSRLAAARGNWQEAATRWQEVRERFPEERSGYEEGAIALRELGRTEEADAVLAEAAQRSSPAVVKREPTAMSPAETDSARATQRTAAPPERTPASPEAAGQRGLAEYVKAAIESRDGARYEEAEALMTEAIEQFPAEPRAWIEWAFVVHTQRHWAEADRRWQMVRTKFAGDATAYVFGGIALRELGRHEDAESLLADAVTRFPENLGVANEYAWLATLRRQWSAALERWERVRRQFPDRSGGYTGIATVLRELRRFDDAESVLTETIERFPGETGPRVDYARIAHSRGDWQAATQRWELVREHFPDQSDGYVLGAVALRELGRIGETEKLLEMASTRFPTNLGAALEYAWIAHRRRDWEEASQRWKLVRTRFPEHSPGYVWGASTLREASRFDDAEALASEAANRFPQDSGPPTELAMIAQSRRDWAEAATRWERVRARFPGQEVAYVLAGVALRELGRFDDAEVLLAEACDRFPNNLGAANEFAWLAAIQRDWEEALRRWELVRSRFPEHMSGYTGAATTLRHAERFEDAEAMLAEALERFPEEPRLLIDWASLAQNRRDWEEAARRWERVRERLPGELTGYLRGAGVLRELKRLEEAEAMLSAVRERFPAEPELHIECAVTAEARGEWGQAIEAWAALRVESAQDVRGFIFGARALRQLGRIEEAEALLTDAIDRFPNDPGVVIEYAWLAQIAREWPEATRRWEMVRTRHPKLPIGYSMGAAALREMQHFAEAESLLAEAVELFPADPPVIMEGARVAQAAQNWDAAAERWGLVRAQFPSEVEGYDGLAAALMEMGRHDEAETVLRDGIERFPSNERLFVSFANLATTHNDFAEALSRWNEGRRRFPVSRAFFTQQAFVARLQLSEVDPAAAAAAEAAEAEGSHLHTADATEPSTAKLLMQFESLGGDYPGCEIGLVQRSFGAEPLGLLRWTTIQPSALVEALRSKLEGVGEEDQTELYVTPAGAYKTKDRRYGMDMVTFVEASTVAAEEMRARSIKRLKFLREKLVNDLTSDTKIFVYRTLHDHLSIDDIIEIKNAMAIYGKNRLLYVRLANAEHSPGDVELVRDDLAVGYVARFSEQPVAELFLEGWERMFKNAEALFRTGSNTYTSQLLMQFESLGGAGHGCEFGIIQREFGAEPLGLLRWADLAPHLLAEALENEFEGVGEPENTVLFVPETTGQPEYWTRDSRYWMAMRTFIPTEEVPLAEMCERACRRLQFLSRKLIEDLRSGEKIFVYKVLEQNLSDPELERIHSAMRRYGDNTLLYVRYEDEEHPNGTVERSAPGLMIGYIDRFSNARDHEFLGLATDSWVAICRKAYELWRLGQDRAGGGPAQLTEAQAPLASLMQQDRQDLPSLIEQARRAEARNDWQQAQQFWSVVREKLPQYQPGYVGEILAYRKQGRISTAESLLHDAVERFPDQTWFLNELGTIAQQKKDWPAAERCWRASLALSLEIGWVHLGLARSLIQQGKAKGAKKVLSEAVRRFPDWHEAAAELAILLCSSDLPVKPSELAEADARIENLIANSQISGKLLLAFAEIAKRQQDWPRYRSRVELAAEHFPEHLGVRIALASARELFPQVDDFESNSNPGPAEIRLSRSSSPSNPDATALMFEFESLGGEKNDGCEFGLVQRELGAEPLGLLRFATIEAQDLVRALDARFAGLGEPETIELRAQGHRDWQAIDSSYRIRMDHTHLNRADVSKAEARRLVSKRMRFLGEKLIRDLTEGAKIFVYRSNYGRDWSEIQSLFSSLMRYGKNRLLFVSQIKDSAAQLKIEKIDEGLYIGHLDRFSAEGNLNVNGWVALCRQMSPVNGSI